MVQSPFSPKLFEKYYLKKFTLSPRKQFDVPQKSRFRPGDSTINQLLSIMNEILVAFDQYPTQESGNVFLDISKAFDKVWKEGLTGKLKPNGIQGNFRVS